MHQDTAREKVVNKGGLATEYLHPDSSKAACCDNQRVHTSKLLRDKAVSEARAWSSHGQKSGAGKV